MKTRYRSSALRHGRYSAANTNYHVTIVCAERHPVFQNFDLARLAIKAMQHSDSLGFTSTCAFVVMPDHIHWLFQLGKKDNLSRVVQRVKSQTTRNLRQTGWQTGPLWQAGFHDHAVRNEECLVQIARYIVANPLRAGIVRSVRDYPHWDCIWVGDANVL
ncbi:MAG: transposase [Alcanivoracaceae bacterium]|uniref:REP-associated tyrosine transposase n=1 Tax=Alcanivorax profundi TaxID=2338368 RepID=UPI000C5EDEF8|nr:transposase [Alcanivoracaceae bacterium]